MDNGTDNGIGAPSPRVALVMDLDTGSKEWVPEGYDLRSNLPAEVALTEEHMQAIEHLRSDLQILCNEEELSAMGDLRSVGVVVNAGMLKLGIEAYEARTELLKLQRQETARAGQQLAQVAGRVSVIENFAKTVNEQLMALPASVDQTITIYQRIMAAQASDRARQEARISELRMLAAEAADTPAHRSEMKLAKEKIRVLQETIRNASGALTADYVSGLEVAHKELSEEVGALRRELEQARAEQRGSYTGIVDELRKERDTAKGRADELAKQLAEVNEFRSELSNFRDALYRYWCAKGIRRGEMDIVRERFPAYVPAAAVCAEVDSETEKTMKMQRGVIDHLRSELERANAENISLHSAANMVGQLSAFIDGLAHSITTAQKALETGRFESELPPALGGDTASGDAEKLAQEALEVKFGQGPTPEDPHAPVGYVYRAGEPIQPDMFGGSDYPDHFPSPLDPDVMLPKKSITTEEFISKFAGCMTENDISADYQ